MLSEALKSNPDLNGTYSCWEPNAFDNQDGQNINGKDGNRFDPQGQAQRCEVATMLMVFMALVWLADRISAWLRQRLA